MKGEAGRRIPEAPGTRGHTRRASGLLAATSRGLQGAVAGRGRARRRPGAPKGWGCGQSAHPAESWRRGPERPRHAARLPLPSPWREQAGAGWAPRVGAGVGAAGGLSEGAARRGSGEGGLAALSPAVRRWQQVPVCPAAGAAGAAGAGHRALAFPVGGLASRIGSEVQGSHSQALGDKCPITTHPGGTGRDVLGAQLPLPSPLQKLPPSSSSSQPGSRHLLQEAFCTSMPGHLRTSYLLGGQQSSLQPHNSVGGGMCLSSSLSDAPPDTHTLPTTQPNQAP